MGHQRVVAGMQDMVVKRRMHAAYDCCACMCSSVVATMQLGAAAPPWKGSHGHGAAPLQHSVGPHVHTATARTS